jgi:DNA mismatch endonuclease (patch repair protein)
VFVDGCFWHGCPQYYVRPRSASEFWAAKLVANVERDRSQTLRLLGKDWDVLRFWEHEVTNNLEGRVGEVVAAYMGRTPSFKAHPIVAKVEAVGTGMELWHIEDMLEKSVCSMELRPRRARKD